MTSVMKRSISRLLVVCLVLVSGLALAVEAPILVVGHKNPDSDSFIAAIAVAHLKTQQGLNATAIAQGEPNPETRFILDTFGLPTPPVRLSVAGFPVILVDHADYPQAPDDLDKAQLIGIVDHHKLGGITTDKPMEVWMAPLGSTQTLVARMYAVAGIAIPKDIAGGMLSAILSDTVIFKSPTTTAEDRSTAENLARIAGIEDINRLGMAIFEAKSQFKGVSGKDLLKRDFKSFNMGTRKVGVAQLETVDLSMLTPRKAELLKAMEDLRSEGYNTVMLMLTDIMNEGTDLMVATDEVKLVETAMDVKLSGDSVWVPGLLSRKKQVIPRLEKAFK